METYLHIRCTSCGRRETLEFTSREEYEQRRKPDPLRIHPTRLPYDPGRVAPETTHKAEGYTCSCGCN